MKKKILSLLLAVVMLVSLTACSGLVKGLLPGGLFGDDDPVQVSNEPEKELDLSQYDIVGEWSEGKAYVHKTEGSYDYVKGSFAYIDTKGNLVGQWHSDEEWVCPTDFCGDRALVYLGTNAVSTPIYVGGYYQKACYAVINERGQEMYRFAASLMYQPILSVWLDKEEREIDLNRDIHEFEDNGYLFYKQRRYLYSGLESRDPSTWPKTHLLIPDEKNFLRDITFESYMGDTWGSYQMIVDYDLEGFGSKYVNGYLKYENIYKANGDMFQDFLFFDTEGKIALDVAAHMKGYSVHEISNVRGDNTFSVEFGGVDGNTYSVDMDMQGNWVTEPKKVK